MAATCSQLALLVVYILLQVTTSFADYCIRESLGIRYPQYCKYGCCGSRCCSTPFNLVGLIVGLCIGVGVLITVICIIVCICRRRRSSGIVVHTQPGVIVQQSGITTQGEVINMGGIQPGVLYPPQQGGYAYPQQGGYAYPQHPYGAYPQPAYSTAAYPPPYPAAGTAYNSPQQPLMGEAYKS